MIKWKMGYWNGNWNVQNEMWQTKVIKELWHLHRGGQKKLKKREKLTWSRKERAGTGLSSFLANKFVLSSAELSAADETLLKLNCSANFETN